MKIILKIIISMHAFNIFCQENNLNQAIKALMVVKGNPEQFEVNQQLCYLPSSIIKILNLQDDNHIADLNIIKNAIATTLPNLQDSEQVNSLKIYLDQIDSGIFLVINSNTIKACTCPAGYHLLAPGATACIYIPNNYSIFYTKCTESTSATTS